MNTKDKGNIGEVKVLSHLLSVGYNVSIPFGDNTRYDLIAENDGQFTRIQVKTRSIVNGIVKVPIWNVTTQDGQQIIRPYTAAEIDEIWIYCVDNHNIYRVMLKDFPNRKDVWLRVIPTTSGQYKNINNAEDYIVSQ